MNSMTGYGRGECAQGGFKITVEISSVNRKQSEIAVYLPRDLEALEPRIRDEINRRIARGRLTARYPPTRQAIIPAAMIHGGQAFLFVWTITGGAGAAGSTSGATGAGGITRTGF